MNAKLKVGLIGVSGYTGMELVRLLATHPYLDLIVASSRQEAGKTISEIYPFMYHVKGGDILIQSSISQEMKKECDLVFLAVPHGVAMGMAHEFLEEDCKVVDLSADFRLKDEKVFQEWYKTEHTAKNILSKAVYGLPEINKEEICKANLVANPGCYPTASLLALYPAIKNKCINYDGIIIDAKSGTSGAGRKENISTLYCEVADNFKAYGLASHRHTPEIEQELSLIANTDIILSFNPHLLPINRGILATIYGQLTKDFSLEEIHELYSNTYTNEKFVRVLPLGKLPETKNVRGSLFCDIGLTICKRTKRLIITSAIDNLSRGASAQALANANLMLGGKLEDGLLYAPFMP